MCKTKSSRQWVHEWFIEHNLPINFTQDQTKSILSSKAKLSKGINISFAGCHIKKHHKVEYCLANGIKSATKIHWNSFIRKYRLLVLL